MKQTKWILLANLILLLGVISYEIVKKEHTLAEGKLILMKLRPVDPRSIMQGDYMRLRYEATRATYLDSIPSRGYFICTLDELGVASKVRFQENAEPLNTGEYRIKYFWNDRFAAIGAESYLFEEGSAAKFDSAKYGGLRVHESGESLLVGLYDGDRQLIQP